jgi:hypothetical protein
LLTELSKRAGLPHHTLDNSILACKQGEKHLRMVKRTRQGGEVLRKSSKQLTGKGPMCDGGELLLFTPVLDMIFGREIVYYVHTK